MTIILERQDICREVMTLTAVIGRNRQDMQGIAVFPENVPLLDTFLGEAVTEAENELRKELEQSTDISLRNEGAQITLRLENRLRRDEQIRNQVKSSFFLYLVHYAVSRWTESVEAAKDLAETYRNSAAGYISKMQSLMWQRSPCLVRADDYRERERDYRLMDNHDSEKGKEMYSLRKRDVQPVCHQWPEGVMKTTDGAVPTDADKDILVSKP